MSDISKIRVGETLYDIKDQAGREAFANSKEVSLTSESDNDHIPTSKAAYDYGQTIKNEILGKKVTSISATSDDEHVPSAKAVYDYVLNNGSGGSGASSEEIQQLKNAVQDHETTLITLELNRMAEANEYYSVYSVNTGPDFVDENTPILSGEFEGLYRVSNYLDGEGLFKLALDDMSVTVALVDLEPFFGLPIMASLSEAPFLIIKQNFISTENKTNEETGETETVEVEVLAGMYASTDMEMHISHLKKRENYIVQQKYSFIENEAPLFNYYHKVGDPVSTSGLYSILGPEAFGEGISLSYCAGGKFIPISEIDPTFQLEGVYGIAGGSLFGGVAAVNVVTPFTLPAGALNNDEDVEVSEGLYLFGGEIPYFEIVKLQEKEIELNLDALFDTAEGTVLEQLMSQISSSDNGEAAIEFTESDLIEEVSLPELYALFLAAFHQKGSIKIRTVGNIETAIDMLSPISLWTVNGDYAVCAGTKSATYTNGSWIETNMQLFVSKNSFGLYCKAKME